jgi:hypothetical protein
MKEDSHQQPPCERVGIRCIALLAFIFSEIEREGADLEYLHDGLSDVINGITSVRDAVADLRAGKIAWENFRQCLRNPHGKTPEQSIFLSGGGRSGQMNINLPASQYEKYKSLVPESQRLLRPVGQLGGEVPSTSESYPVPTE